MHAAAKSTCVRVLLVISSYYLVALHPRSLPNFLCQPQIYDFHSIIVSSTCCFCNKSNSVLVCCCLVQCRVCQPQFRHHVRIISVRCCNVHLANIFGLNLCVSRQRCVRRQKSCADLTCCKLPQRSPCHYSFDCVLFCATLPCSMPHSAPV